MKIRIADIVEETSADGPGLRTSIYFQGCSIRCLGCHNKDAQDINGGTLVEIDDIVSLVQKDEFLDGVSILGGEPFYQLEGLLLLLKSLSSKDLSIWVYTGYTIEFLSTIPEAVECLKYVDVLVDGPFVQDKASANTPFRGSSNQRIIHNPFQFVSSLKLKFK